MPLFSQCSLLFNLCFQVAALHWHIGPQDHVEVFSGPVCRLYLGIDARSPAYFVIGPTTTEDCYRCERKVMVAAALPSSGVTKACPRAVKPTETVMSTPEVVGPASEIRVSQNPAMGRNASWSEMSDAKAVSPSNRLTRPPAGK